MHSCVTSKNVKWCHLIWPTLYIYIYYKIKQQVQMKKYKKHRPNSTMQLV